MTYWVHVPSAKDPALLIPSAPHQIPGKGYPKFFAEVDGFTFEFASLDEMRVCVEVLGGRLLPNTLQLARQRDADPEEHWLRKMPDHTKPWRYREKAVRYLQRALTAFDREVGAK